MSDSVIVSSLSNVSSNSLLPFETWKPGGNAMVNPLVLHFHHPQIVY